MAAQTRSRGSTSRRSYLVTSFLGPLEKHLLQKAKPEFSRLCAVLSFAENELMDLIKQDSNLKMDVAILDGAILRCNTLADDIAIKEACCLAKSNVVPLEVKRWSSQNQTFLRSLFHRNLAPDRSYEKSA